jgi:hypothetical protein
MKTPARAVLFLAAASVLFGLCVLGACFNISSEPIVVRDQRWIGGTISLEARRLDANTYSVTARGAAVCSEAQVMEAWVQMADKVAAGRRYDKTTKTQPYESPAPAPGGDGTRNTGLMIVGQVSLK